jgi:hypothetical protein
MEAGPAAVVTLLMTGAAVSEGVVVPVVTNEIWEEYDVLPALSFERTTR